MKNGFSNFLNYSTESQKYLSESYFSYLMCLKICDQAILDDSEEGKKTYLNFLTFLIQIYLDLINNNQHLVEVEEKIKVIELMRFVFSCMIQEVIVLIAKNIGVEELFKVHHH